MDSAPPSSEQRRMDRGTHQYHECDERSDNGSDSDRKPAAARSATASRQSSATGVVLDETTKLRLAKRVSCVASSLPGALSVGQDGHPSNKKGLSQHGLKDYWNSRMILKNRTSTSSSDNYAEDPPSSMSLEEQLPLDELQERMTDFRQKSDKSSALEVFASRKKRRIGLALIVVFCSIVIVAVVVGVAHRNDDKQVINNDTTAFNDNDDNMITTETVHNETRFDDCNLRDNSFQSDQFMNIRSMVLLSGISDLDILDSVGRKALCWLTNVEIEIMAGSDYAVVERFALASIFFRLLDGSSNALAGSNWLSEVHVCEWDYVTCGGIHLSDSVTKLSGLYNFDSVLPSEVALLSNLTSLQLSKCGLHGQIPTALAQLSKLEILDFSKNDLTGEIPPGLATLPYLQELTLNLNHLQGQIPPGLFQMSQLKSLRLGTNELTGPLPTTIQLTSEPINLQIVQVDNNKLTGTVPNITHWISCKDLDLSGNFFRGPFPDFSQLKNLESLDIQRSMLLTGTIPDSFWSLPRLKYLSVADLSLSGTIANEIDALSSLEVLDLSRNRFKGSIPTTIGNLSKLRALTLDGLHDLTGSIPTEIGRLTNLETFVLPMQSELSGNIPSEVWLLLDHNNACDGFVAPCSLCNCCVGC